VGQKEEEIKTQEESMKAAIGVAIFIIVGIIGLFLGEWIDPIVPNSKNTDGIYPNGVE
jgi:hypothetical protein